MWLVGVVAGGGCDKWGEGGIYGCGCKEVYILISSYYLSLLLLYLFFFAAPSLLFVLFLKRFSFLFQYFLVIKFYVLNTFFAQYKHTYG